MFSAGFGLSSGDVNVPLVTTPADLGGGGFCGDFSCAGGYCADCAASWLPGAIIGVFLSSLVRLRSTAFNREIVGVFATFSCRHTTRENAISVWFRNDRCSDKTRAILPRDLWDLMIGKAARPRVANPAIIAAVVDRVPKRIATTIRPDDRIAMADSAIMARCLFMCAPVICAAYWRLWQYRTKLGVCSN